MRINHRLRENISGYSFISLWLIGFVVFTFIPLFRTFWFSLNEVKVSTTRIITNYVGNENYRNALFLDVKFTDIVINYLLQMLVYVPVIIVFALFAAILLNAKVKGKGIFRTIYFLPVIIISGPVMQQLLDQGAATLPGFKDMLFLTEITNNLPAFLTKIVIFLVSSFIMILWFSGVQILVFLAGLQKVDTAMYEAASIDGASKWEVFWKITLPALNPMIVVNIVYTVVTQSTFALNPVIILIKKDMYDPAYGFGYAASLATLYFLILVIMLIFFVFITYRREKK